MLPADVISGADVIKGAQASLSEGAIGGLVNLRSASPFDQTGQHGAARLEGDRNMMSDLDGYKFSGVYTNTFADDTFGVLLGVVYAERKDRTDIAGNDGGWTRNPDPNDESWLYGNAWGGNIDPNGNGELDEDEYGLIGPGQFRVGSMLEEKKRRAFTAKLEWRPSDNVKIVADGLKTRLDSPQVGYQQSYYPLFAPDRWSDITIQDGIVTGFAMDNADPELALNPELLNVTEHRVVDTDLYGINGEWAVNDAFTLTADLYRSTSKRYSGGQDTYVVLRMNQPNVSHIGLGDAAVPECRASNSTMAATGQWPGERRVRQRGFQHALHGAARRQHRGRDQRRLDWRQLDASRSSGCTRCSSAWSPPSAKSSATWSTTR